MRFFKNMSKALLLSFLFAFSGLVTPSRAGAAGIIESGLAETIVGVALAPVMGYLYWKASREYSGQSHVAEAAIPQPAETGCVLVPFIPYILISSVGIIAGRWLS